MVPKLRLIELEGHYVEHLAAEEAPTTASLHMMTKHEYYPTTCSSSRCVAGQAMQVIQRMPTGVDLACYFDTRAPDGTVLVPKSDLPRGVEFVFKA